MVRSVLLSAAVLATFGASEMREARYERRTPRISHLASRTTRLAAQPDSSFARLIDRLSEPGGYFDTDNLISNEASYLHVMSGMRKHGVRGGAYIGVGPDQNFSYIAQVRPTVAYIIDIRRDNLIEHLFFKSIFAISRNRAEYLALLMGRSVPANVMTWNDKKLGDLVQHFDSVPANRTTFDSVRRRMIEQARLFGVPFTPKDVEAIGKIHEAFFANGLDLRFTSFNRSVRPQYPTYRQLLLERDLDGRQTNYLAREEDFQFLKGLEARNLIIPVVGNLAGDHAMRAIAREIAARGERVSAVYTSNVEFYLFQDGTFEKFAANMRELPRDPHSIIIRSYFGGRFGAHPQNVSGYYSTQLLQTVDSFVDEFAKGGYRSYWDVTSRRLIDSRTGAPIGSGS